MQKLGQHFLKNQSLLKTIIASLEITSGETIIEIGAGHGELTIPLAQACGKNGARVISIEKDEDLFVQLKNLSTENLDLRQGDVLKILPQLISELATYKLVGNIPYYLTGHLLRIVGELEHKPTRCIFMIQEEVAERACAEPPKMNRLAASVQFWSVPKIIARVPKKDFSPPPKVDSAVIQLETKSTHPKVVGGSSEHYYATMRMLFAQPRKTILNNLADGHILNRGEIDSKIGAKNSTGENPKETIESLLKSIDIDPGLRPQNLTIEDIIRIAETFI